MQHTYFSRHNSFKPRINNNPNSNLGIVVVLPSFNEPDLFKSLKSIAGCKQPNCAVEVIVVVNFPDDSPQEVVNNAYKNVNEVESINREYHNPSFQFHCIKAFNLPKKHTGVGLARKIGMDEAAWRLLKSENDTKIIVCFDADATCANNFLFELEKLWLKYPQTTACSIQYAHPLEGDEYEPAIYKGIAEYELHLRYYVQAGRFIGHPFSYQTVGSSMACGADAYLRFGGMNKNKAGEDFYFLQKIIPHGGFKELSTTTVYPSPRPSYRVPFGTGRAITKYLEGEKSEYCTYNIQSFIPLKSFLSTAPQLLHEASDNEINKVLDICSEPLKVFLTSNNFTEAIKEINKNTSDLKNFTKRFFLWFDAFKLLKYLNFANEFYYPKQPVTEAALELLQLKGIETKLNSTNEILIHYREMDAKGL
jgi:glycosyltransferase involved in cell wall biosynthesis